MKWLPGASAVLRAGLLSGQSPAPSSWELGAGGTVASCPCPCSRADWALTWPLDGKEPCGPSSEPRGDSPGGPLGHHAEAKSLEHRVAWGWVQSPQWVEPPKWRQPAFWRRLCLQFSTLPEAGGHLCGCGSSPELSRSKPTAMLQLRCGYPVSRFPTS